MSLESFQLSSPLANEFQVLSILQEMYQLQSLTLFTVGAYQVAFFRALSRKTAQSGVATVLPALRTVTSWEVQCLLDLVAFGDSRPEIKIQMDLECSRHILTFWGP
ncbi:hypothetical protein C8J56DRAFT_1046278 [Mycena floridula]|nr:hypothetical protein C8J56DRAFT_1046278 [Mycena floridula]